MCTMPPWPGAREAERVPDYRPATEIEGMLTRRQADDN